MEYTFDNIGEWVANLATKPKAAQFRTYAQVERDNERGRAAQAILNKFDPRNNHHGAKDVTIINDDMAIVTFTDLKSKTYYIPVVGDTSHLWFSTFEGALLGALSLLKTGGYEAAKYAGKVLDVDM